MKGYVFLVVFLLASLYGGVADASPYQSGSFDPVREDVDMWICYDYSINYARENPEWGIVTLSHHPKFYGNSHIVNFKVENDKLYLYDSQFSTMCIIEIDDNLENINTDNYWYSNCYYKFWSVDQTPWRNYRAMVDNSMEWLNV